MTAHKGALSPRGAGASKVIQPPSVPRLVLSPPPLRAQPPLPGHGPACWPCSTERRMSEGGVAGLHAALEQRAGGMGVCWLLSQSLELNSPADNYTVCEGDNATLSCFIDEHVTRVAWLNRSNILYAGNDRWTSDPRVRLLINTPEEFSILITQVGLGDEGLYTCSFQTRHQPYTTQVYLIVHVPARIVNISSPVTVNEGGSVNLLCLAVGRPEPTVTWRQLRDGFTSEGEILEIFDIQRGQAGEYECVTHNGVNSAPDSRRVLVTVNYPPTITDVTSARTALGRAALLRCEAMAVPPADFQWYKDDRLLSSGTAEGLKVQTERTRSMLLFANVSARHYGNYTCRAANRLGASSASMRLGRPGSLENSAPRPPGPLTLLSALSWLWWRM
ncbi:igLON family member 5 [Trichechus manatus latirostris]|uniref:IgLON family member 5 n=1 Tax=Trichechus manatus latirostris TaxID=127582 RepID=A0A2Y9DVQ5_TRIMA|nr:igLON family member 5 [Trichechus manatus latirostris]